MFPSDRPVIRSMSSGVMTCRCRIFDLNSGAKLSTVFTTVSPNASRFASVQPPLSLYGAYCTKIDMTCFPGGAMPGSIIEGNTMSIYGRRENSPYFASSYARSTYSRLGLIENAPRCWRPMPGMHVKLGSASSARFTLPDEPRNLKRLISPTNSAGRESDSSSWRNVRRGSRLDTMVLARNSSPYVPPTARVGFPPGRIRWGYQALQVPRLVRQSEPGARRAAQLHVHAGHRAPAPWRVLDQPESRVRRARVRRCEVR